MAKGQFVQPLSFEKAQRVVINHYMDKLGDPKATGEEKIIAKLKQVKKAKNINELALATGDVNQLVKIIIKEPGK